MGKIKNSICILLSEDALKIAQVIKGRVSNVSFQDVKGFSDDRLAKTLRSMVSKLKPKKAEIFCLMPSGMTTSKNLEIPSTSPDEIKAIVSLQAGRHTPLSREEIEVGYINLGSVNNNATRVLLVIANKQVLKKQLAIFDKAELQISKVLFIPETIASFYSKALSLEGEAVPTGIIDVGDKSTDFIITFKGHPITTRNIPVGNTHISEEGDVALNRLVDELSITIDSYQSEDIGKPPANYIISSNDNLSQQLQSVLKEKLGWDSQPIAYTENVVIAKPVLKKMVAVYSSVSFLDVISAGTAEDVHVDLMPDEIRLQKSVELQGKEMFKAAMLVIGLLILFVSMFGIRLYFKNAFLKKMRRSFQQSHDEVMYLEKVNDRTMVVKNYIRNRMESLDVIHEIYKKIPSEIYLNSLSMDSDGKVRIQGISSIPSSIFNFGTELRNTKLFKSVNIGPTTAKKDRGKDVTAFDIVLNLKPSLEDDKQEEE